MGNTNINKAKINKNDEFYTKRSDIEKEVFQYKEQFANKIIYLNCDNPMYEYYKKTKTTHPNSSQFWNFFYINFDKLKLKKIIASYHDKNKQAYKFEYKGGGFDCIDKTPLKGNGDFRSKEAIECLKEADIICTNPPFSLFKEYMNQLIKYKKKFLIIGNFNAVTYKNIFPLFKNNKIWMGYSPRNMNFRLPNGNTKKINACWFTNLYVNKELKKIPLKKSYYNNQDKYPYYENYNAIEVSRIKDIPKDFEYIMGVPITFLTKFNPEQFEIVGMAEDNGKGFSGKEVKWDGKNTHCVVNGQNKFKRIFIKNKKAQTSKK